MTKVTICGAILFLALVGRVIAVDGGGARYTITALESLTGGVGTLAAGLNDRGQIVGVSIVPGAPTIARARPVIWSDGSSVQRIWSENAYRFPGGGVTAINNAGQMAGVFQNILIGNSPLPHLGIPTGEAFFWDPQVGRWDLGTLGGLRSEALGINDAGQVVGSAENAFGQSRAFIWDARNGMRDLGALDGEISRGTAINDHGEVVGWSTIATGAARAFVWDDKSGMRALPSPNGTGMRATAINDLGQVVGTEGGNGIVQGGMFIWDEQRGMQLFPMPDGFITPNDINNFGTIVGELGDETGATRAFLWDSITGVQDLNAFLPANSGWALAAANEINDQGQIVGYGLLNGGLRGFVMTPIPEPRSVALLLVGGVGLLFHRYRRRMNRR